MYLPRSMLKWLGFKIACHALRIEAQKRCFVWERISYHLARESQASVEVLCLEAFLNQIYEHFYNISLNLFHALLKYSESSWWKMVLRFYNFADFIDRKYYIVNFWARSFYVMILLVGWTSNHSWSPSQRVWKISYMNNVI